MVKFLFYIDSKVIIVKLLTVCMSFICVACSVKYAEVEKIAQKDLERYRELYVIALQTGKVTLPLGGKYPHVTYPNMGGLETPIDNVWLVNGGYLGEIYECRGCDSCMTCYRDAGLITYDVIRRDSASVTATVQLTEKGQQYLIENQLNSFYSIVNAWRRREQLEIMLIAKEKFDVIVQPSDTMGIYNCEAYRALELTPFLEALGGTVKHNQADYVRRLRVDCRNMKNPVVSRTGVRADSNP